MTKQEIKQLMKDCKAHSIKVEKLGNRIYAALALCKLRERQALRELRKINMMRDEPLNLNQLPF